MGEVSGTPARRSRVGSSRVIGGQSASREEKLQKEEKEGGRRKGFFVKRAFIIGGEGTPNGLAIFGAPYTERVDGSSFRQVRASGTPPGV